MYIFESVVNTTWFTNIANLMVMTLSALYKVQQKVFGFCIVLYRHVFLFFSVVGFTLKGLNP